MEEGAKEAIGVLGVGPCVEDVGVPEVVDRTGRTDLAPGVDNIESKELPVEGVDLIGIFFAPAAFLSELPLQHRKVKTRDFAQGLIQGFA